MLLGFRTLTTNPNITGVSAAPFPTFSRQSWPSSPLRKSSTVYPRLRSLGTAAYQAFRMTTTPLKGTRTSVPVLWDELEKSGTRWICPSWYLILRYVSLRLPSPPSPGKYNTDAQEQLIRAYRRAALKSQAFNVRLIELVAVTMHQLGVLLFKLDACMHQGGRRDVERVTLYQEPPLEPGLFVPRPRVTLFSHHGYLAHDVYPEGIADIVGYWAEDRILGGVTVFDRPAEERTPQQPPNVYFNACRDDVTYRYFQLRDEQQQAVVDFFLADNASQTPYPLPIIGDRNNRVSVDSHIAILHRHIYRDIWERKPPGQEQVRAWERRPQNEFDYPEHRDLLDAVNRTLGLQPFPPESDGQSSSPHEHDEAKGSGSVGAVPGSTPSSSNGEGGGGLVGGKEE